jgi:hypothetical protein
MDFNILAPCWHGYARKTSRAQAIIGAFPIVNSGLQISDSRKSGCPTIAAFGACLESTGNQNKETIMIEDKSGVPRDDLEDRSKRSTIKHETIPGKAPIHPAHGDNRAPNEKGESSPDTGRSTADDDLN